MATTPAAVVSTGGSTPEAPSKVRVLVVDDNADIRLLLRLQFDLDDRFEVVAEAGDGREAIAMAAAHHPDLVILDRRMPVLDGLQALPQLREVAPDASIVVYTAERDALTRRAALAAGALEVFGKEDGPRMVERLVATLVDSERDDTSIEVRVGPVPSEAALVWVENTRRILAAVEGHPEVLPAPIPGDVLALFHAFLDEWHDIASDGADFQWVALANAAEIERVDEHWTAIDGLGDHQLAALGVQWSPPAGKRFFDALTAGVFDALRRHEETRRLAARLPARWSR